MKAFLEWATPGSEEERLAFQLDADSLPRHIAIIMDGNGRWAKRRHLPRVAGHRAGVRPVRETIEACSRLGIDALTVYAFSVENWKRPRSEVETLWQLLRHYLDQELPALRQNNVRFQVIGRIAALPERVQRDLDYAIVETSTNTGLQLNVALNYGGRAELVDAVNAILAQAGKGEGKAEVTEETISSHLYTATTPDPDLLIRTSGEMRVSNFLLWQIAYAEIWVTEKLWPDFQTVDLLEAVLDFQKRERRYGGLGCSDRRAASDAALVATGRGQDSEPSDSDSPGPSAPAKYSP